MDKFGPFASVVAIAIALVAVFGTLILQMLGNLEQWTWLAGGSPSILVAAGPRMVAVAAMALTYVTINQTNYMWFSFAALLIGALGFWFVIRFDRLRRIHVAPIQLIDKHGNPLLDKNGSPRIKNVLVGLENQLKQEAKEAFVMAKGKEGNSGLTLREFMSGYGRTKLNDPEALWSVETLADIHSTISTTLMCIVLSAAMVLFLAAFVVEVAA